MQQKCSSCDGTGYQHNDLNDPSSRPRLCDDGCDRGMVDVEPEGHRCRFNAFVGDVFTMGTSLVLETDYGFAIIGLKAQDLEILDV